MEDEFSMKFTNSPSRRPAPGDIRPLLPSPHIAVGHCADTEPPQYSAAPGSPQYSATPGLGQHLPSNENYKPVMNQPTGAPRQGDERMVVPQRLQNCPPGLEYLSMIDQLLVHQKVEILEALIGFETENKYTVKNNLGQKIFFAGEDSDCLVRQCCGPARPFEMKIFDNYQHEVIHLSRPLNCDACCFPCCLQFMEVFSPPGTLVGTIQQEWSICIPSFTIRNIHDEIIFHIDGPICTMGCGDVDFKIMSADGTQKVGKISKQWTGLLREMFTDADYFGITFPMDLDVSMKAVMLGACFLIDAMFFESSGGGLLSILA